MLSAACPACGRPAPVSLAAPNILRCPACRFTGPMPQATAQHLYAAAQILYGSNVRERQLSEAQRRAVAAAGSQNLLYFLVLGISAFPAFIFAVAQIGLNIEEDSEDWIQASVMLITPFFVVMAVGLVIFSGLVKRRRQLQDTCAAAPPQAPGEPCTCHVCGAPLVAAAQAAVVRCTHCSADNVVSADVVARAAQTRQVVLADYGEHLRREIAQVNAVANRATFLSFASSLLLPPATVVALVLIVFPLILIKRPADPSVKYTHRARASGDCVAKVTMKRAGGAKLYFAQATGDEESFLDVPTLDGIPMLHVGDFVGKDISIPDDLDPKETKRGHVEAVSSDMITGNHLDVRVHHGDALEAAPSEHPAPEHVCLVAPAPTPPPAKTDRQEPQDRQEPARKKPGARR